VVYLGLSLINLLLVSDPLSTKLHYGSLMLTVAAIGYLILLNMKRNHQRLTKLNQELSRSGDLLAKAQAMAQIGNWEMDMDSQQTKIDAAAYGIYQLEPQTPISPELMLSFYPEKSQTTLLPAIEACNTNGTPFDLKLAMKSHRGELRYVRLLGFQEEVNGKTARVHGLVQDITQDKKTEEILLQAKDEAEAAVRAKSQFLSVMSHEIRTPMNAVIGSCHLLFQENPREDQKDTLETLHHSAENLLSLINDILDFSKIEAGRIEMEKIDFSLPNKLHQLVEMYRFRAEEKQIGLSLIVDEDIPDWVQGDPTRLTQIMTNLLGNALKFTEEGEVSLRAEFLSATAECAQVRLSVKDTGIGIPEEKLATIFDQFTQASSETTRKYGGSGMGLAISKGLAELMGSELKVSSEPGKGATFSVVLSFPIGKEVKGTMLGEIEDTGEYSPNLHILLAEDNPINVKIATRFLEKWGFRVTVACNGREACERATAERFDLILMDLQMPEMGGMDASRYLRKEGLRLPILALSAEVSDGIREKVRAAGMNDYTSKPFVPKDLRNKILFWVGHAERVS
jgi:signal transduction histidine kinase